MIRIFNIIAHFSLNSFLQSRIFATTHWCADIFAFQQIYFRKQVSNLLPLRERDVVLIIQTSMPRKWDSLPRSFKAKIELNCLIKLSNLAQFGPVMRMSSTYIRTKTIEVLLLHRNKDVSDLQFLDPHCIKHPLNLSNHALGACLRP